MKVCDRCHRIASETASGRDLCVPCFSDVTTILAGFFAGKGIDVTRPDVVDVPIADDAAIVSQVAVK